MRTRCQQFIVATRRHSVALICLLTVSSCSSSSREPKPGHDTPTDASGSQKTPGTNGYLAALEANIRQFPNTTSVLVMHKGALLYERYFGKGSATQLNDTRSATKSLAAIAMGVAMDKHKLSLSSPAFKHLQSHAPFDNDTTLKQAITIKDLLTMSSALDCNDNTRSPGNESNMYPKRHWVEWATNLPTEAGYTRDKNGFGRFSYCTAGSMLLGQIISNASGRNLGDFFARHLFAPLGITRWRWTRSPSGEYMTGGGLRLSGQDLARIGQMLLDGGRWNDRQIIPKHWSKALLSPVLRANSRQEYGYQFWSRTWRSRCGSLTASYMAGNGGNAIIIAPSIGSVFVVTRTHYNRNGMHDQTIRMVEDYLLNAVLCKPSEP